MAKKKKVKKAKKKPAKKTWRSETEDKIANNRHRVFDLSKRIDAELKDVRKYTRTAAKNETALKNMLKEFRSLKKRERVDKRVANKNARVLKRINDDLNVLKKMELKDFNKVKEQVNMHSDYLAKESKRFDELVSKVQGAYAQVLKASESKGTGEAKKIADEEVAFNILTLYFEEIARTGFKKTLNLSEIVNAYMYTLGRVQGSEALAAKSAKLTEDYEDLMKDIDTLKESIDEKAVKKLPTEKVRGFSYTNSKGQVYYLHQRGKLYYFSKDPFRTVNLPSGRIVKENPQTGLPILKKKR